MTRAAGRACKHAPLRLLRAAAVSSYQLGSSSVALQVAPDQGSLCFVVLMLHRCENNGRQRRRILRRVCELRPRPAAPRDAEALQKPQAKGQRERGERVPGQGAAGHVVGARAGRAAGVRKGACGGG